MRVSTRTSRVNDAKLSNQAAVEVYAHQLDGARKDQTLFDISLLLLAVYELGFRAQLM